MSVCASNAQRRLTVPSLFPPARPPSGNECTVLRAKALRRLLVDGSRMYSATGSTGLQEAFPRDTTPDHEYGAVASPCSWQVVPSRTKSFEAAEGGGLKPHSHPRRPSDFIPCRQRGRIEVHRSGPVGDLSERPAAPSCCDQTVWNGSVCLWPMGASLVPSVSRLWRANLRPGPAPSGALVLGELLPPACRGTGGRAIESHTHKGACERPRW